MSDPNPKTSPAAQAQGSATGDTQPAQAMTLPNKEEMRARMAAHTVEMQKQHPEADLSKAEQWWGPAIDFGYDVKVLYILSLINFYSPPSTHKFLYKKKRP